MAKFRVDRKRELRDIAVKKRKGKKERKETSAVIRPGVNGDKETAMANAKKSAFHQTHRKILTSYYKAEGDVWLSGNNA